jgi:hypothetical protein
MQAPRPLRAKSNGAAGNGFVLFLALLLSSLLGCAARSAEPSQQELRNVHIAKGDQGFLVSGEGEDGPQQVAVDLIEIEMPDGTTTRFDDPNQLSEKQRVTVVFSYISFCYCGGYCGGMGLQCHEACRCFTEGI